MEKLLWVVPIVIFAFMFALMYHCTKTEEHSVSTDSKSPTSIHKGHNLRDNPSLTNELSLKEELLNSFGSNPKLMLDAKNLNRFINDSDLVKISEHLAERALIDKIDFELNITCSEEDGLLYFDLKVVDFLYTFKGENTTKVIEFLTAGALNDDEKSFILVSTFINTSYETTEKYSKEQLLKTIEEESRFI